MKKYLIYLFLVYCTALNSQGFRTIYYSPGSTQQLTHAIFELSTHNYIGAGIIIENVNGSNKYRLNIVGLDNLGKVIWSKKYGDANIDYGANFIIHKNFYFKNNYLYFAGTAVDQFGKWNGILTKFNLNGDTLWQKVYRDSTEDVIPQMVTQGVDGGFLITGWFQNWINNTSPCLIIKTDGNGNELWSKRIHKTIIDVSDGKAIIQDSATKKIVIVGSQYIGPNANSYSNKHNILILDSIGNKLSQTSYPVDGTLQDLIQTKDKYFVAAGGIAGNKGYSYILKFDVNNPSQPLWRIDNFGPFVERNGFSTLTELTNGDIMTAGGVDTTSVYDPNTILVNTRLSRFTTNGIHLKTKYYAYKLTNSNINGVYLTSLNNTSDGGLIAAIRPNNIKVVNPFLFVKYDSNGCDSTLLHCSNLVGNKESYDGNNFFGFFPNPTKDIVNIDFFHQNINCYAKVIDVFGKILLTQKYDAKSSGQGFSVNLSQFEKGIYFLQVWQDENLMGVQKIIKE